MNSLTNDEKYFKSLIIIMGETGQNWLQLFMSNTNS